MTEIKYDTSLKLPSDQYVEQVRVADSLALHYTAGYSAPTAIAWWKSNAERVAVPFIAEKTGTMYQCHDPKFWAWHLGASQVLEMRTIGIEIVNIGYLTKKGNDLFDAYGRKHCSMDEKNAYVEKEFRALRYWAAYPAVQIDAVAQTVRQVCAQFNISKKILSTTGSYDPAKVATHKGIFTHENVINWKTDVGPAFPWQRFADLINVQ